MLLYGVIGRQSNICLFNSIKYLRQTISLLVPDSRNLKLDLELINNIYISCTGGRKKVNLKTLRKTYELENKLHVSQKSTTVTIQNG